MTAKSPSAAKTVTFAEVLRTFDRFAKARLSDRDCLLLAGEVGEVALQLLEGSCQTVYQGERPAGAATKKYDVFTSKAGGISRPVRRGMFVPDVAEFRRLWIEVVAAADPVKARLVHDRTDDAFYTCAQAFSCAVDVFKPESRKTPGTFFEAVVSIALGYVSGLGRGKQIAIPGTKVKVTTDLVLKVKAPLRSLAVASKTSTRERIDQPFVHQRILDAACPGRFQSIVVVVSEVKRTRGAGEGVEEICVPDQVDLFQKHVAGLSGLYYLDPPTSYVSAAFASALPVRSFGELLRSDLSKLLSV